MNIEKLIPINTKKDLDNTYINANNFFIFILLDNFSLFDFSSAIEVLRLANKINRKKAISWKILSIYDTKVLSSNGMYIQTDGLLEELNRNNNIVICGGTYTNKDISKVFISWIRKQYRKGINIIGLSTATEIMALAGILKDKKCTIHWENTESFLESFPNYKLNHSIYTIDDKCYTSAGGTTSIDLFLHFVANKLSNRIANSVAEQLNHTCQRTDEDKQRISIQERVGVRHTKLSFVLNIMEDSLEDPISPSQLAKKVGISTRQLERLFRKYLNLSPKKYYLELRLYRSKNLLLKTNMSIINVALSCGFSSPSHFSKCYRNHFNISPYKEREQKCF